MIMGLMIWNRQEAQATRPTLRMSRIGTTMPTAPIQ
jgi:hypothetical protein